MEKQEVRTAYDRFAPWYDTAELIPELLGAAPLRRWLLERAHGRILEVAIGTGRNLAHYPPGVQVFGVDLSTGMLAIAQRKARRKRVDARFSVMDGERLAFPDHAFDTVVTSLTLCTFPDPQRALREMKRVCRPDGKFFLVEHGRSTVGWIGRWQDRGAEKHAELLGCHWNREPLDILRAAGLEVTHASRRFLGIFHGIEARPSN